MKHILLLAVLLMLAVPVWLHLVSVPEPVTEGDAQKSGID